MPPRGDVQLTIGYWLVSHKETLRKWWAISLIAFIVLSFLWGLLFSVIFFGQSGPMNQQLLQRVARAGQWPASALPSPTAVTAPTVTAIIRDDRHVDLAAVVDNPNAMWGASTFISHFVVDGQSLPKQTTFINPSDSQVLISLNVSVADSAKVVAAVAIDQTVWSKASSATLPEANFSTDSQTLTPTTVNVNGNSVATVRLQASVTNRSVYNFRHVVVPILVRSGEEKAIVAVDQITTDAWPTLSGKSIESTWSFPLTGNLTATLMPQVSRFDSTNVYR